MSFSLGMLGLRHRRVYDRASWKQLESLLEAAYPQAGDCPPSDEVLYFETRDATRSDLAPRLGTHALEPSDPLVFVLAPHRHDNLRRDPLAIGGCLLRRERLVERAPRRMVDNLVPCLAKPGEKVRIFPIVVLDGVEDAHPAKRLHRPRATIDACRDGESRAPFCQAIRATGVRRLRSRVRDLISSL